MDWICFINGNQALCFSSVAGAETLPLMGIIREARVFRGQILMVSPSCLALQMKGFPRFVQQSMSRTNLARTIQGCGS